MSASKARLEAEIRQLREQRNEARRLVVEISQAYADSRAIYESPAPWPLAGKAPSWYWAAVT